MFRTHGGRDVAVHVHVSARWHHLRRPGVRAPARWSRASGGCIVEGLPEALGEPTPTDPNLDRGPLADAVRNFTVFCELGYTHFVTVIAVTSHDPMFDPRSTRLTNLYNGLQLVRPVVFPNPVVARWGGLITRYQSWLAITPTRLDRAAIELRELARVDDVPVGPPVVMEFLVRFTPDPRQPSTPFNGVVACVAKRRVAAGRLRRSVPAMPSLPAQSTPGVNGACRWTPPGPGSVTIQARLTYRVTFWANGYTEALADYVWSSTPTTFRTGELSAVNTNASTRLPPPRRTTKTHVMTLAPDTDAAHTWCAPPARSTVPTPARWPSR